MKRHGREVSRQIPPLPAFGGTPSGKAVPRLWDDAALSGGCTTSGADLLLVVQAVDLVEIEQVVAFDLSSIPIEHENELYVLVLASD